MQKRLHRLYAKAPRFAFDNNSKLVLFSDCHRGDGSWADSFAPNQNLYFHALRHYYENGYTYIELGDGDELWENKRLADIMSIHSHVYWLLGLFHRHGRYIALFGNHDMIKKDPARIRCLHSYFDARTRGRLPLCPDIRFHEAAVLKHSAGGREILLLHGHQVDFLNYDLWQLARFLVRYVWRPLVQLIGLNDPTNAAKNYRRRALVERRLTEWAHKADAMLIAGHTHRPVFPAPADTPYFNDGSCVHPRCITCIEICEGIIALVKWQLQTKADGTLFVGREVLEGPSDLNLYLKYSGDDSEAAPAHNMPTFLFKLG